MTYNADNRRTSKETTTAETKFIWDQKSDNVLLETNDFDSTQVVYTNEPGLFGSLISQYRGSTANWFHFDALGSTRNLTNSGETITDSYTYDAWGNVLSSTGSTVNPFQYVGQYGYYFDAETGSTYIRARVYEPTIGRWWSADPLRFVDGMNLYQYAGNHPLITFDSSGQYGIDFHFYTIYYIIRARGWSHDKAYQIAGWSQYVDDNPLTDPLAQGKRLNFDRNRRFHFWKSAKNVATKRNPSDMRQSIGRAVLAADVLPNQKYQIRLGALLHTFADTWAHEGFTAWHNDAINKRTGSFRPNVGHADAAEGGHFPDNPYNNLDKALEAAKTIYTLFDIRGNCTKHIPWHVVEQDLRKAFDAPTLRDKSYHYERTTQQQVDAMQDLLKRRFKTTIQYNFNNFADSRLAYLKEIEPWRN